MPTLLNPVGMDQVSHLPAINTSVEEREVRVKMLAMPAAKAIGPGS